MKTKKPSNKLKLCIKITETTVTILSLFLIVYVLINFQSIEGNFKYQVQTYGIPSLFILSILLDLVPQFISPIALLATSFLAGINIYYATIAVVTGSIIGSTLGFYLGEKYMYKAVKLTIPKSTTEKITKLTNKYGKIIVPIAAISPLPYLPILLGAMNFSKRNFLIYGLIPRTLSFIFFGYLTQII